MKPLLHPRISAFALAVTLCGSAGYAQMQGSVPAQVPGQPIFVQPLTPDADALAEQIRALAANPSDVNAMIRAGELTLKLDDATAAAGFFARAERIDPSNPRIKAGKATLLVDAGRPGAALQMFAEAEMLRGDVRSFAADRGLAYDLIGEQERAQRDYRLALRDMPNAETTRRYALSLGISGRKDEALQVIDTLLRSSDRGAWRARAFILAMNGDTNGAERIAASMMPGGLGQGLQPFFDRLPKLGPVDRAFAVHFGEVRASPQRLADARLTPRLPVLQPEPGRAPVAVASVAPQQGNAKEDRKAKRDRNRRGKDRVVVATATPPVPLPQPPAYQGQALAQIAQATAPAYVQPTGPTFVQPIPSQPPAQMAARTPEPRYVPPSQPPVALASNRALPGALPGLSAVPERKVTPAASDNLAVVQQPRISEPVRTVTPKPAPVVTSAPVEIAAVAPKPVPAPAPVVETKTAAVTPAPALPPAPGPMKGEDSILATIIANIVVPESELAGEASAVASAESATPETSDIASPSAVSAPAPGFVADAAVPDSTSVQAKLIADQKAADRIANEKKIADDLKAVEAKKVAETKAAETRKAAEAKKLADARKAEELKKKNDPKILEPSRIWVQVAGGSNEDTLPKEWARVKNKAPLAFKGKSGWTTPLRATNRVLAGPFKTDAEARSFVNALSKEGVSAFTFTSDAGQKVTKLAAK